MTTMIPTSSLCPSYAAFFGSMGAASALIFANFGAAYGTAKAGTGVAQLGIISPGKIMRGIVPVVMAGILGIYGLIVALLISTGIKGSYVKGTPIKLGDDSLTPVFPGYSAFQGYMHLGAGLAAGFASLAAGLTIGIVGDASVRAYARQDQIFVAMILMLIFAEALGLYGLIIALIMIQQAGQFSNNEDCMGAQPKP
eukprot:TRINITY_DN75_c0_g2_i1.p1 TRINITY_DN75_c0_g2~~TRINITY_DN75_c0_g2_i1.p1  ORF type:complete len:222 (+),score=27.47 TRINITY_DN75_c0_g2_i1:78-668(+)